MVRRRRSKKSFHCIICGSRDFQSDRRPQPRTDSTYLARERTDSEKADSGEDEESQIDGRLNDVAGQNLDDSSNELEIGDLMEKTWGKKDCIPHNVLETVISDQAIYWIIKENPSKSVRHDERDAFVHRVPAERAIGERSPTLKTLRRAGYTLFKSAVEAEVKGSLRGPRARAKTRSLPRRSRRAGCMSFEGEGRRQSSLCEE